MILFAAVIRGYDLTPLLVPASLLGPLEEVSQSKPSKLAILCYPLIAQSKNLSPLILGLLQLHLARAMLPRNQNGAKLRKFGLF